jgi:hypothetical protein
MSRQVHAERKQQHQEQDEQRPVAIPKYNNENRWYIEKYQSIVSLFE